MCTYVYMKTSIFDIVRKGVNTEEELENESNLLRTEQESLRLFK